MGSERKKSHDKVYPKGYVEMMERQYKQIDGAAQDMYRKLLEAGLWEGPALQEYNGKVLTHDILKGLDLLDKKADGSAEAFEEDCEKMQARLLAQGAGYTQQRQGSVSSDSDHSQHSHARSRSHGTPTMSQPTPIFKQDFSFQRSAPSSPPAVQSPAPRQHRQSFPAAQPSPLQQNSPAPNDPQLYQSEWAHQQDQKYLMQPDFALPTPDLETSLNNLDSMSELGQWQQGTSAPYDIGLTTMSTYPQMMSGFGSVPRLQDGMLSGYPMDSMHMDQEYMSFSSQMQPV